MKRLALLLLLTGCAGAPGIPSGADYLGAKYIRDPLGEERAPDSDPFIRTDAFDCTTFVETVMAGGDVSNLNQIRYKDGEIDFMNRNHFIETDWLRNNSNRVENVSSQYGKTTTRRLTIDKAAWMKKVHKLDSDFAPEFTTIEYVPYKNLTQPANTETMIVLFISANSNSVDTIGTELAVTHMGLLLPGGQTLRHASSAAGHVVDAEFMNYAKRRRQMGEMGVAFIAIK
ncbi:MAG: DUF1460 domain-containing protein [Alphaproteobacteria bacterium]|nr:DUF1460 domain-containing protein [Alphaproteobacteria bacterium]MBQ7127845.1 DUF1460 domain-containing protein [Alphaproteobacteria bacterium]